MVQGKSLLDCNALNLLCFIFLSTFVVWYLRYHWRRRHLYLSSWKRSGPFPLPFVGNALSFVGSTDDILEKIMMVTTKYKSPVPIWFGPKLIFAISEPKDMETVMNSPYALEKQDVYKFVKMFVGEGLFTASAPTWKRHRKIIMPTLNQNILNSFVSIFAKHSDILLEQLETKAGKGEFDIFSYISNCSLKNLCETAMGISVNEETVDSDFIHWTKKAMEICFKRMVNIWYHSDFIFSISSHSLRCNELLSKLHNFVGDVVRLKREEYQTKYDEISKRKSFLEHLIKLSEQSTKFNDQELRDEVVTFMIAGTETNATLISYVFIVLGMYPEIQEKVYQEL
ncbi:hypothetical protein FQR65_LT00124 [Abscondita terminalis]|nr:hypothetical protein FQR65_LT00124 [Abscondita terminalis]